MASSDAKSYLAKSDCSRVSDGSTQLRLYQLIPVRCNSLASLSIIRYCTATKVIESPQLLYVESHACKTSFLWF